MEAEKAHREIWLKLARGVEPKTLGVPLRGQRFDVSRLKVPQPSSQSLSGIPGIDVLSGFFTLRGIKWHSLDFTGSNLTSLRFEDCRMDDCVFDKCCCQDWRMWNTVISNSSFCHADLRDASLGAVTDSCERNRFEAIHFDRSDMRRSTYKSAEFVDCVFSNCKLDKVDFHGSCFVNCRFEGLMREVQFHRTAFGGDSLPANRMFHVDFRQASLRGVEFRRLDLDTVVWPDDDEHIILHNYREDLNRIIQELEKRPGDEPRAMVAYLGIMRKWAGPRQVKGVINKREILEYGGREVLDIIMEVLKNV